MLDTEYRRAAHTIASASHKRGAYRRPVVRGGARLSTWRGMVATMSDELASAGTNARTLPPASGGVALRTGPLQFVIIQFDQSDAATAMLYQLQEIRHRGLIDFVGLLLARRDNADRITLASMSDLGDADLAAYGDTAGYLLGLIESEVAPIRQPQHPSPGNGNHDWGLCEHEVLAIARDIPRGCAAIVALFEHSWLLRLEQQADWRGGALRTHGWLRGAATPL